jgi:hypothetical protein
MGKTYFQQIPLEEALKSVAGKKMSGKKRNPSPISSVREILDRSERLVQQTKERVAASKVLQETYDELLKELRNRRVTKRP